MKTVQKAFKLRLIPKREQASRTAMFGGACRWLWNRLLKLNMDLYEREGRFAFHKEMSAMLPALKKEFPWLADVPAVCLQRVTRNLSAALTACFKNGKGFPRFKKKVHEADSFYLTNQVFAVNDNTVRIPKIGDVAFSAGARPEGTIKSATVRQDGDRWFCAVQCDVEIENNPSVPIEETCLGIDLGLTHYAALSDGTVIENPRFLRKRLKQLRKLQRHSRKCQKGSKNRRKRLDVIRRLHRKIRDQRADFIHKLTTSLIAKASVICVEDLNVKGLQRSRLALSVADAGWGEFLRQIAYKADWAGIPLVKIGRFDPSSQVCSCCGHQQKMPLHARVFRCPQCGMSMDRDQNAAINIKRWGWNSLVGQGLPEPTLPASTPVEMALAS